MRLIKVIKHSEVDVIDDRWVRLIDKNLTLSQNLKYSDGVKYNIFSGEEWNNMLTRFSFLWTAWNHSSSSELS